MACAPNATRTRDLPLRRSFHTLRSTAAFLVRAGFLVVWLPLDVSGFCPVLARGWHGTGLDPSLVGYGHGVLTVVHVGCRRFPGLPRSGESGYCWWPWVSAFPPLVACLRVVHVIPAVMACLRVVHVIPAGPRSGAPPVVTACPAVDGPKLDAVDAGKV